MSKLTRRKTLLMFSTASVAACAPRASVTLIPDATGGSLRDIFVATTRAKEDGRFQSNRSEQISYAKYQVSIPPTHQRGKVELPGRLGPDPNRHFVTTQQNHYPSDQAFRASLGRALSETPNGAREAVIYVHGFNNTFADGLYRIAQIGHDLNVPAVSVHYSWPSAGKPLSYAYDRDSALFARDGLVDLLHEVHAAGAHRITLVAHSMGSLLAMEAIRQLEISKPGQARHLLNAVVLFSPDIDVELFHMQATRIGRLPDPFVIFTSRRDRALALSARLTGQTQRLGNLQDYRAVEDLDVIVLDVSAFARGGINHFSLAKSPALQSLFRNIRDVDAALGADQAGRAGLLPGTVLTLQNATAIILSPATGSAL